MRCGMTAWSLGLLLCVAALGLSACGGAEGVTGILADEARVEAIGAQTQRDSIDIPDRVLGESTLEDFLIQSADAVMQADAGAFGPCRDRHIVRRTDSFREYDGDILDVLKRNGARRAWRTKIYVGGCAEPRRHNVLVVTYRDQPSTFIPLLPGSTKADAAIQGRAAETAYETAAARSGETCRERGQARIRLTTFLSRIAEPGTSKDERRWREVWTTHYCGRDYDVVMTFTPQRRALPTVTAAPQEVHASRLQDWPRL